MATVTGSQTIDSASIAMEMRATMPQQMPPAMNVPL